MCQNIENLERGRQYKPYRGLFHPLLKNSVCIFCLSFRSYCCMFASDLKYLSLPPLLLPLSERPYFLCRARVGVPCGALTWANRSANSTPVHLGPSNTWSGPRGPGVQVHAEDVGVRKRSGIFSLTAVPCFHGCSTDQ